MNITNKQNASYLLISKISRLICLPLKLQVSRNSLQQSSLLKAPIPAQHCCLLVSEQKFFFKEQPLLQQQQQKLWPSHACVCMFTSLDEQMLVRAGRDCSVTNVRLPIITVNQIWPQMWYWKTNLVLATPVFCCSYWI